MRGSTPDVYAQASSVLAVAEVQWRTEVEDEVLTEAADLLEAEHGRVAFVDRLRASQGIVLGLAGGPVMGKVVAAGRSVVVIETPIESHIVPADAIRWIRGAAPALCVEAPSITPTVAGCLRELGGEPVEIIAAGLHLRMARLLMVGADHVDAAPVDALGGADLGQRVSIAFQAIERVTRRRRTDELRQTRGSGRTSV